MSKIREVCGATIKLTQPGNTLGSTTENEYLDISLEYQTSEPGTGEDGFVVLKTEGWSLDSGEELVPIVRDFMSAIGKYSRGET
jgi:hypothetical protein